MSSKVFLAPVLLNSSQFQRLRTTPLGTSDWFLEWHDAVFKHDPQRLISLLHWGLQNVRSQASQEELSRIICHYLAVADGHSRRENFGYVNSSLYYPSSHKTLEEQKREIADKAWMELCNRVFCTSECGDDIGGLTYWHTFAEPVVAKAFVHFIQPYRWKIGNNYVHSPNVDASKDCAYHRKALAFTRQFLRNAWCYKYLKLYASKKELDGKSWEDWKFFLGLRPELIELMHYYGMLDFLHELKLDSRSRKKLHRMAYSSSYINHPEVPPTAPTLQELYGQHKPGRDSLVFTNRTAARIVMMYPLLVNGRKRYVREAVAKNAAARAEKVATLEAELRDTQAKLQALK